MNKNDVIDLAKKIGFIKSDDLWLHVDKIYALAMTEDYIILSSSEYADVFHGRHDDYDGVYTTLKQEFKSEIRIMLIDDLGNER